MSSGPASYSLEDHPLLWLSSLCSDTVTEVENLMLCGAAYSLLKLF